MNSTDIAEALLALQRPVHFTALHARMRTSPAAPNKKYRTADLRKIEQYSNFGATYLVYKVTYNDESINLTTHQDSTKDNIVFAKRCLTGVLKDVFEDISSRNFDPNSIVHLYMHLKGMDSDFRFNASGEDHKTLQDFLHTPSVIEHVVNKFAEIIQSGKPVILETGAEIRVVLYEPPKDSSFQPTIPMLIGAGKGGWGHSNAMVAFSIEEFVHKSNGIVQIKNSDKMCMARAIAVGLAFNNKDINQQAKTFYNNIRNVKRRDQEHEARRLCLLAGVSTIKAADETDLQKFTATLNINIDVYELNHTFLDKVFSSEFVRGRMDIFLLYNKEKKHYDCITSIDAVARALKNNRRTFCKECRKIVTPFNNGYHNCYRDEDKKYYHINGEVVYHEPDYDLLEESTDLTSNGFIKVNDKELKPLPNNKIWYFDFETSVVGTHKETNQREERLDFEDDPLFEYAMERGMENYQPFPFFNRELDMDYNYSQEVNYVEMQCADGDETKTMAFYNIQDFCQVLTQPDFQGAYLIAHYGQGFDFQLLYNHMFRYDSVVQGKLKDPVMRGNKIIKGYLFNDITLIDSYNYLSTSLSAFPKMFGLQELSKGYFPHHFNIAPFQHYKGPIPDKQWYGYREKKPEEQKAFITWHEEQIAARVQFDFQKELKKYCHSDVDILRRGMEEFRRLFIQMKDVNTDKALGTDPLLYMTIAALAYDGVYRKHYLQPDTIKYVGRPKRGNYSAISIEWLEHMMTTKRVFIQHAENNEEYEITLYKPSGDPYRKKVDGYDRVNNTVYEFLGCFFHSCKYCYQQDMIHPLKSDFNNKEKKILHGHVYASTMRMVEDIKNAGYNVEVIWECEWKRVKNKQKLESNTELCKRLPLNPRDAYYGGRTNATSLYKKCTGSEKIFYIDVVSMYPTVMSLDKYWYPKGHHEVRRFDDPANPLLPLNELFGFQKCKVIPANTLFHPVLPERCDESGKLLFPLYPFTGTWTHVELMKAVSLGYVIEEVYEQHHYPPSNRSNELFKSYVDTFFDMKKRAEQDKNPGLKQVAKLCLNSFYGKFGFNIENQDTTKIIRNRKQLWSIINSSYKRSNVDVINNAVAVATFHSNDEYTTHQKSNVYIAAYVTAYARLKLYEALEILQDKALYFDTDSCVYVSPTGQHLIPISDSGELGTWSDEAPGDFFTEFVSAGPKTYALKSHSGKHDVCKSKGFLLSVKNKEIFNFDSLRDQVLHKAYGGQFTNENTEDIEDYEEFPIHVEIEPRKKQKLIMHKDEQIMTRNSFKLQVKSNPGKMLHMTYDKRVIITPTVPLSQCTQVYTLPHGHRDVINRGINDLFKESCANVKDRMHVVHHINSFL